MSRDLPPLNALRAFEATARLNSVSQAAEQLHVTHGAISRQLKVLEEHLGLNLFVKDGRGIKLTDAGVRLRDASTEAFERVRDVCAELTQGSAEAPFVLGCSGSLLARWLIPRLGRLNADLPDLRLHLSAGEGDLDPGDRAWMPCCCSPSRPGRQTCRSMNWPASVLARCSARAMPVIHGCPRHRSRRWQQSRCCTPPHGHRPGPAGLDTMVSVSRR